MRMSQELLRQLPGVDVWLQSEQGAALCAEYSRPEVVAVMRSHLSRIRNQIAAGTGDLPTLLSDDYANLLRADLLERRRNHLRPVINATGIVIHTNLGRAPLAREAIEAVAEVSAGYSNLEYNIDVGQRGSRNAHTEQLLRELTGAEAALVVNNCAAAVLLGLRVLAADGEVVISRGELIEIGGSFRMPDVIAESGAKMIEVGTTNRTSVRDYTNALTEQTRVLLQSHPSNYRVIGFTANPNPRELAALARENNIIYMHDLGSGSLCPLPVAEFREPTVGDCIAAGADLVTFSGDKLLGGPQAGILAGRADLIDRLRRHPLARAFRIDKLSLAALEATLRLYRPPYDPLDKVPVLRMISASRSAISDRARRFKRQIAKLPGVDASIEDGVSFAGGGSLPMHELATRVVRLKVADQRAVDIAGCLRAGVPAVVCRVDRDAICIDLRTVQPGETRALLGAICDAVT